MDQYNTIDADDFLLAFGQRCIIKWEMACFHDLTVTAERSIIQRRALDCYPNSSSVLFMPRKYSTHDE